MIRNSCPLYAGMGVRNDPDFAQLKKQKKTSCQQADNDGIAYSIAEKDLIPEGITFSSTTNSFYISSIKKTNIIQINAETGAFNDCISSDLLGMSFLGMIVDDSRGYLWACGNKTVNDKRHSTVAKFNLKTGELIKSYLNIDTIAFTYNDLVQDKEGNVYATNSRKQDIYRIDFQTDSVTLFFEGNQIGHPNGITVSPDNKYLYVATKKGIRVLEIKTRKVIDKPGIHKESFGVDGLKYYENSLIGIQNRFEDLSEIKINRYFWINPEQRLQEWRLLIKTIPFSISQLHLLLSMINFTV